MSLLLQLDPAEDLYARAQAIEDSAILGVVQDARRGGGLLIGRIDLGRELLLVSRLEP